jgi:probable phosphoglycerate mutase
MRHGQAENNINRMLVGRHIESHLTDEGKKQVADTAKQLKSIPIDKVFVSPVIRTIETAQIVCDTIGIESYQIDERLYEIELGKLVGMNYEEVTTKYGDLFLKFYSEGDPVLQDFGVETFASVKKRIRSLLDQIIQNNEGNTLMVTHLDPIKAAIAIMLDLKPESLYRWHIRNASLTILKYESNTFSLTGVNVMAMHRYPND